MSNQDFARVISHRMTTVVLGIAFVFVALESMQPAAAETTSRAYQIGGTVESLVYHNNSLFIAQGAHILAYDLGTALGRPVRVTGLLGGRIRSLAIAANVLYAQTGSARYKYELQADNQLDLLCSESLDNTPSESIFYGDYIIDSRAGEGISFHKSGPNCSNVEVTRVLIPDNFGNIIVGNDKLAVLRGEQGMSVYSLSDLPNVKLLAVLAGPIRSMAFVSDTMLLIARDSVLELVDISDLVMPRSLSSIKGVFSTESILYVGKDHVFVIGSSGAVQVLYVGQNTISMTISGLDIGGHATSIVEHASGLFVSGEFGILEITQINGAWVSTNIFETVANVFESKPAPRGKLMLMDLDKGIAIIDRDTTSPSPQYSRVAVDGASYFDVDGSLLATAFAVKRAGSLQSGLRVLRTSVDGTAPYGKVVDMGFDLPYSDVALRNRRLYICESNFCPAMFDVGDDNRISQRDSFSVAEVVVERMKLFDDIVVVSATTDGVFLIDVSNPDRITEMSHIPSLGSARDAVIIKDRLYVADWKAGVVVYNDIRSSNPKVVMTMTMEFPYALSSIENGLVAASSTSGRTLTTFDLSQAEPRVADVVQLPCRARSISSDDAIVYVAAEGCGVFVIDSNVVASPTPIATSSPIQIATPTPTVLDLSTATPLATPTIDVIRYTFLPNARR